MRADVTAEHLTQVVRDIAVIDIDDGVAFNLDTSSVQEIRERADYPGLRVRVAMSVGPWQGIAAWDVSTGEPIAPWPTRVTIDRILGEPITLLGYAPETIIAEKGVTILERGITSTRWRDYVDIVQLDRRGIDDDELLRSARAVAQYRGATLEPVAPHLAGYGAVAQAKWATEHGRCQHCWRHWKPAHVGRRNMDLLDAKQVSEMIGVPVGTLRHWRHSDIGPASFTLGRRVVYRRDEVSRWISKRRAQLDVELAPDDELRDRLARVIASTSRFSAKETIDTVPTSRYALRTPLASATWSLAPTNLTGPTSTRARAGPPVPSLIRSADGGIPNPDRNRSGDRISCSRASGPPGRRTAARTRHPP